MKFPVIWVDNQKPTGAEWVEYIEPDLTKIMAELDKAEDLICHTIMIGDEDDGPIVVAYGKEDNTCIFLQYLKEAAFWE